jgi:hypothetical protein
MPLADLEVIQKSQGCEPSPRSKLFLHRGQGAVNDIELEKIFNLRYASERT